MRFVIGILLVAFATLVLFNDSRGQRREICGEEWVFSDVPSNLNKQSFVIYGRVSIERSSGDQTALKVVVRLRDGHSTKQHSFKGSGTYCFERSGGGIASSSGEITVDVNGEEVESRPLIPNQPEQREDFKIRLGSKQNSAPPAVVSAKFNYKRSGNNAKLFEKHLSALAEQRPDKAIEYLTTIITDDPADYIASASLGSIYYPQKKYNEAEMWFKRSVEIKPDFTHGWLSLSRTQYAQKKYDAAIESCKKLIDLEPNSAAAFYIMGESYLRTEKANLAVVALNEAIRLDPIGMAEGHLALADLYDFNGAKKLAAKEYKAFIEKVPGHRDRKVIEQYIKDNPE
jgi:tetratricopeptide (TPR) repeat protein